jgi:hypothetical protein
MDIVLKRYSNKISHLAKCTNTRPKKIAKKGKTPKLIDGFFTKCSS